jgi:hypothetical protein
MFLLYIYYKLYTDQESLAAIVTYYRVYILFIFVTVAHANCSYVAYDIDEEPCIK